VSSLPRMASSAVESRTGSDMGVNMSPRHRIAYRPTPAWHTEAARELRATPATVRNWAHTMRRRIRVMLRMMVRYGARELADLWMADMEGAFADQSLTKTQAWDAAVLAGEDENVKRDAYLRKPTQENEAAWHQALRKETAANLTKIRVLGI
jgi:hypothetical protein